MPSLSITNSFLNNKHHIDHSASPSKVKRLNDIAHKAFNTSDHVWGYLGKILILTRHLLNVSVRTCHYLTLGCRNLDKRIFDLINRLKLFSIVGIPFTLASIHSTAKKIFKSYQLQDTEGVALNGLSLTMQAGDVVDSTTTFVNASLIAASQTPVALFSAIGMPLAFGMLGLGSISRIIQIAKTHLLQASLKKEVIEENQACSSYNYKGKVKNTKMFLEKRVGVTEQDLQQIAKALKEAQNKGLSRQEVEELKQKELLKLKEKKKSDLLRFAPPEAVALFDDLYAQFAKQTSLTEKQTEEMLTKIDKLSSLLDKKMKTDIASLVANLLALVGLCLFFATVPPALPFLFLAVSFILRIAILGYQDWTKKKSPA